MDPSGGGGGDGGSAAFAFEAEGLLVDVDVRNKWFPLLQHLSTDSDVVDGTSISLMIVAHVTYRSSLLARAVRHWRWQLKSTLERQHWQNCLAMEWYARRRLFLFFRAWQWHHQERWQRRAKLEAAAALCGASALRRAMRAWTMWLHRTRELRRKLEAMCCDKMKTVILWHWAPWRRRALRSIAERKLREISERRLRQWWWGVWRRAAIHAKRRQLLLAALSLHSPSAWMNVAAALPPSCGDASNLWCDVGVGQAFHDVALRFCWIRWLGNTARRRGIRLRTYEVALHRIEEHRKRHVMAESFHRWLIRSVSTLQSRRNAVVTCRSYFRKWLLFVERNAACMRCRMGVIQRLKSLLLRRWQERTLRRLELRRRTCAADAFFHAASRSRLLRTSMRQWTLRAQSRRAYKAAEAAARDCRRELLRHVAVSRLLSGVLLTFWQPSGCETQGDWQRTARDAVGPETSADAPHSAVVSAAARAEGRASVDDPVATLRRRLLSRSAAIPLSGGALHASAAAATTTTTTVVEREAGASASRRHKEENAAPPGNDPQLIASPPCVVCTCPANHLRSETPTPAVSLNTSLDVPRTDPCSVVADGRSLLVAYRAMLATAPAERDEMRILQAKSSLYKLQKEHACGLTSAIQQAESKLQQRLFALQQRALDRQALRAQLLQLTKQLEAALAPTASRSRTP